MNNQPPEVLKKPLQRGAHRLFLSPSCIILLKTRAQRLQYDNACHTSYGIMALAYVAEGALDCHAAPALQVYFWASSATYNMGTMLPERLAKRVRSNLRHILLRTSPYKNGGATGGCASMARAALRAKGGCHASINVKQCICDILKYLVSFYILAGTLQPT